MVSNETVWEDERAPWWCGEMALSVHHSLAQLKQPWGSLVVSLRRAGHLPGRAL